MESDASADGYTSGAIQSGASDVTICGDTDPEPMEEANPRIATSTPLSTGRQVPLDSSGTSQENQSLATIQKELTLNNSMTSHVSKETRSVGVGDPPPKRPRMTRPGKIFKESYFRKIEWTRTFVSGPMDPLTNPHCFYCQICRRNVSIYGKGAAEVKRHYSSREHFRKDQKWRYVHLKRVDAVTGNVNHFVRDRKGNLLGKFDLELEIPRFIDEELVDVGEKLPFHGDVNVSGDAMTTSKSRSFYQLNLLGDYLKRGGDIELLQSIWTNVGSFTNHQSLFSDFDWSEERITVSIYHFIDCRFLGL